MVGFHAVQSIRDRLADALFLTGVYTDYDSIMAYHTGRPSPKGKLILHYTTTPAIEIAEDGKTAKGFWVMAGIESGTTEPVCRSAMASSM